ncbi:MAG: alpha/beta hydrolase [Candidatus Nanopelagicales bacterium]|nr:alpha/beta hydrolase [Candidatus Nanopelagicales bacterium]
MNESLINAVVGMNRRLVASPDGWKARVIGPPITIDGNTLDRSLQAMLYIGNRSGMADLEGATVRQRRARLNQSTQLTMPLRRDVRVLQRTIPGPERPIRIRIYRTGRGYVRRPGLVYYHGGGWALGDLNTHDGGCRELAAASGCSVISVDYRRAPENPFPAGLEDAIAAFRWVSQNCRPLSIIPGAVAVIGDSSGGNFATVVAQTARDEGFPPPIAQGLVYPAVDLRLNTRSVALFGEGFFLTLADMEWFRDNYIREPEQILDPRAAPAMAEDLSGLAPAAVWTAGFDPLRDEGIEYAERMRDAGVTVTHRHYPSMTHGFFGMGVLPGGVARVREIGRTMSDMILNQLV